MNGWCRYLLVAILALPALVTAAIEEEIVVQGRQDAASPLTFHLDREQLARIPGVQDDAIRAVVTLPGVTTQTDFSSGFAIRGTRPVDNDAYLDYLPVGYLFHLTGLSIVDNNRVADVRLLPAAYGAPFQGAIGGIISAETAPPDARLIRAEITMLDSSFILARQPRAQDSLVVAGRFSYYDLVLESIIKAAREDEDDGIELVQLPGYADYAVQYGSQTEGGLRWTVFADGARDEVEVLFAEDSDRALLDPALAGAHSFATHFNRQGVLLEGGNDASGWRLGAAHLDTHRETRVGDVGATTGNDDALVVRGDYQRQWQRHRLRLGGLATYQGWEYDILVRDNGCTEFDVDCRFSGRDFVTSLGSERAWIGNVFIEDSVSFSDRARLTVGLSTAFDTYLDETALEPRLELQWLVAPAMTLSLAAGRHTQLPQFDYLVPGLGNPALDYLKADHLVAGLHWVTRSQLRFGLSAYHKRLRNLITSDPDLQYDNDGRGEVQGLEFMAMREVGDWTGWLALSWSRSTRQDGAAGVPFDFALDQPLVASLVAKRDLGEKFSLSGRAAWHTGSPMTPIPGSRPDPDNPGGFLPVYGSINSERLPDYFRLDLRLDWTIRPDLTVFFELVNASNRANVAAYQYSADYSSRRNLEQLPRFVSFGLAKTWR